MGSWTPPPFTYHDNTVESRTSQVNVPAQDSQDNRTNPPQPHHTVTRSGRIVRPPDYYGMMETVKLNFPAHAITCNALTRALK